MVPAFNAQEIDGVEARDRRPIRPTGVQLDVKRSVLRGRQDGDLVERSASRVAARVRRSASRVAARVRRSAAAGRARGLAAARDDVGHREKAACGREAKQQRAHGRAT